MVVLNKQGEDGREATFPFFSYINNYYLNFETLLFALQIKISEYNKTVIRKKSYSFHRMKKKKASISLEIKAFFNCFFFRRAVRTGLTTSNLIFDIQ